MYHLVYYMGLVLPYLLIILHLRCNFLLFLLLLLLVPRFTTRSPLHSLSRAVAWRESRTRSAATLLMLWETGSGCLRRTCPSGVGQGSWLHVGLVRSPSWSGLEQLPTVWSCLQAGGSTLWYTCPSWRQWWAVPKASSLCRLMTVMIRSMRWSGFWRCILCVDARSTSATGRGMAVGRTPGSQKRIWLMHVSCWLIFGGVGGVGELAECVACQGSLRLRKTYYLTLLLLFA